VISKDTLKMAQHPLRSHRHGRTSFTGITLGS
jgi:hypothetical protein